MITSKDLEKIPVFADVEEQESAALRDAQPTFISSLAIGSSAKVKSPVSLSFSKVNSKPSKTSSASAR